MNIMWPASYTSCHRQNGAVLIVGIIFLLVMTMLGLTAMQTTALEERMSGNMRDRALAFQAAEMALRNGEQEIFNGISASGNGYFDFYTNPAPDPTAEANWPPTNTANARSTSWSSSDFPQLKTLPQYWIEARPGRKKSIEASSLQETVYDITARSTGGSGNATVILSSTARQ